MGSLQKLAWKAVIVVVLIFGGGWFIGGVLNLTALLSPQLVSKMECPAGSTVRENFVQQSFDQPGQKTLTFSCVDQGGNPVSPLTNAETQAAEFRTFYPAGVIVMALLVAAWFIRSARRGAAAARANSSPA